MATAKKVELAPPPPFKVELTLNQEEAISLRTICGAVGGQNRRVHTELIYKLLGELGIESRPTELSWEYKRVDFV